MSSPPHSENTGGLVDAFGREIRYLRLSVTERCNLRCNYCRPAQGRAKETGHDWLTPTQTVRLARIFVELGIRRIRLTGGEPLVRPDIISLAAALRQLPGLEELSLSTNAVNLDHLAVPLKQAGVGRVNISLDSLDEAIFSRITRGGRLEQVLGGIDAALAAGLHPVKVNMVVMKGINDHEIPAMVHYAQDKGVTLRFIETMPVGESGTSCIGHYMPAEEILAVLANHFGTELEPYDPPNRGGGPARYFRLMGGNTSVGVISALSQHFCDSCNRMRLTARGTLILCLGRADRQELAPLLQQQGITDAEIAEQIIQAVTRKPRRHHFQDAVDPSPTVPMVTIGG